jgi:hypothetical protein
MKIKYLLPIMLLLSACTIKWADKEISAFQMQVREGSASIYSTKLYGCNMEVPIPGGGSISLTPFKLQIGYVAETKSVIPTKTDGELPNVMVDLTQESDGTFSDTYSTGEVSSDLYQKEN